MRYPDLRLTIRQVAQVCRVAVTLRKRQAIQVALSQLESWRKLMRGPNEWMRGLDRERRWRRSRSGRNRGSPRHRCGGTCAARSKQDNGEQRDRQTGVAARHGALLSARRPRRKMAKAANASGERRARRSVLYGAPQAAPRYPAPPPARRAPSAQPRAWRGRRSRDYPERGATARRAPAL